MLEELKKIIENSISYSYKIACIIEDEDNNIYKGVSIQNACLRDMISAEQGAIANYLINGKSKVKNIYFLTDKDFDIYRYLRVDFIKEIISYQIKVYYYDKNYSLEIGEL